MVESKRGPVLGRVMPGRTVPQSRSLYFKGHSSEFVMCADACEWAEKKVPFWFFFMDVRLSEPLICTLQPLN